MSETLRVAREAEAKGFTEGLRTVERWLLTEGDDGRAMLTKLRNGWCCLWERSLNHGEGPGSNYCGETE